MVYDTIIIGGGPAGCASAVYVARKKMHTRMITEDFGGQSINSNDIDNWLGDVHLTGAELAEKFETHVRAQEDNLEIEENTKVTNVGKEEGEDYPVFVVTTNKGDEYRSKTVIVAAGAQRRRLNIPGEDEYDGKGVSYCATCDAPVFKGKDVVVVGGGNAGLEAAVDLAPYASSLRLVERADSLNGDPGTADQLREKENFEGFLFNTTLTKIMGQTMVTGVAYENLETGETGEWDVQGVFVEIGSIPNSSLVQDLVELNEWKEVVINHKYASTSQPGIYAAGDITDEVYKQNNISAGDGVRAALSAHHYIQDLEKK
ncbi:MAG: pyridine nucleotide-disulfide oxidoreductase [Parcubacteria group bacterium SW_4_49_11]|nr:MAG: pyridine nucleotide-disulfide oxidoreductase [Parcubacteria group bacterium SW_4_49_11]